MLGRNYRFSINNNAGVAVTCAITSRRWKFASDGSVEFDAETTPFASVSVAASSTAWTEGTAVDNSTGKWIGADLVLTMTPSAAATGAVTAQMQASTDGGTTWPTDGAGVVIGSSYFNASSAEVRLNIGV